MLTRMEKFDYIIVGAGTAGCVLANRLSANPAHRVLLIESGGKDDYFWIDIPVGYLYTINNPRCDWCFKTDAEPGLNNRQIGYARGKGLGGSSSINAMIYMRGQRSDFDQWAALGNRGWGWEDVLPVFKASENYQHGADEFHGDQGELRVEERRVNWEILDAWQDAAEEMGIPRIKEFNTGDNFGCAYFQMNQRKGVRWSASKAFLRPIQHRPNLTVMTNTHVQKLALQVNEHGPRATGVWITKGGDAPSLVTATREVILAAGAVASPQILQLSGIGEAGLMQQLGAAPVIDLPGVGHNLQDHLQIRTIYKVSNTTTLNPRVNSLVGKAMMGLEYLLFKTGPLTMPPSQLGAFAKSDEAQPTPNMEWHVQPLSLDQFGSPLHRFNAITPSVCNLRPASRGAITALSLDPLMAPKINLNYLSNPEDEAIALAGLRMTRRIMKAKALARFSPEEWKPGPERQSDAELLDAARDLGTTIFHPVGTCKMGADPAAVVDDRLMVHGCKGLRVIDASIMPLITSGNTNAPTVMIAEKGAQFIIEDAG
ncbi:GMC family oxidoreductase N-terminal domain-containing protein [Pseudomonadales bacterium]|nr:GMC family oxidoreductase N-terminal domain-containing protein [Pseudomonadales bacterium]